MREAIQRAPGSTIAPPPDSEPIRPRVRVPRIWGCNEAGSMKVELRISPELVGLIDLIAEGAGLTRSETMRRLMVRGAEKVLARRHEGRQKRATRNAERAGGPPPEPKATGSAARAPAHQVVVRRLAKPIASALVGRPRSPELAPLD